jgi:hypothetical protein
VAGPGESTAVAGFGEIADPQALTTAVQARLAGEGQLAPTACPELSLFPAGTTILLRAPATFNGRPVEVSVAPQGRGNVAFVVDPTTCTVVSAIAL